MRIRHFGTATSNPVSLDFMIKIKMIAVFDG
jgi:hypothetical protein